MRYRRPRLLLTASLLLAGTPAHAGTCKMSGGKVDLNVLFLYNETGLSSWKPVFTEASKLLYNATEGHLQFGTINFYVACQPAKDRGDIWITTGTGGASANVNGCGTDGLHVFLSNIHKRTDATAHGQLGMVHELGHYIFGLSDEYGGDIRDAATNALLPPPAGQYMWQNSQVTLDPAGKPFYCQQASGGTGCIMDAGTTITGAFSKTEFCSPSNHVGESTKSVKVTGEASFSNRKIANHQQFENGKSCWEMVKAKLALASVPDPPDTTAPSGHQDLVFNYMGTSTRFMLTLDRSGSMQGAKIDLAKSGARIFVNNSRLPRTEFDLSVPGDEVGLVSFQSSATLDSPLKALSAVADKTALNGIIGALAANGTTNIGGALRLSLNQFVGAGNQGCSESIVLLSDGQHNTGEPPSSVTPDLIARKSPVFSIGLGADADAVTLGNVATSTGGRYYYAPDAPALPGIFAEIQAVATGAAIIDRVKKVLSEAGSLTQTFYVEAGMPYANFNIIGSGFSAKLSSPSGKVSDKTLQAANVSYTGDTYSQLFVVSGPEEGMWKLEVSRTATGSGALEVVASGATLTTHLNGSAPSTIDLSTGAKLYVRAMLSQGASVVGAAVSAEVRRPDGTIVQLPMVDDGNAVQGDTSANDGTYSGLFTAFAGNGAYTFQIRANTNGAYLVNGEPTQDPEVQRPAVTASRSVTITTNVANAPPIVQGDLNGDGKVDCADVAIVKAAYGKSRGQAGYDAKADINSDGIVDIRDLAFVTQRLPVGTQCP